MVRTTTRPTFRRRSSAGSRRSQKSDQSAATSDQVLAAATAILNGIPSVPSATASASASTSATAQPVDLPPRARTASASPAGVQSPPSPPPSPLPLSDIDPMVLLLGRRGTWAGKNPKLGWECPDPKVVVVGFDGPTLKFDEDEEDVASVQEAPRVMPEPVIPDPDRPSILSQLRSRPPSIANDLSRLSRLLPPSRLSPHSAPFIPQTRSLAGIGTDASTLEEAYDYSLAWTRLVKASSDPVGEGRPWRERFEEWGFASPREKRAPPEGNEGRWEVRTPDPTEALEYLWSTKPTSNGSTKTRTSRSSTSRSTASIDELARSLNFQAEWRTTLPKFAKALERDPPVAPLEPSVRNGVWISRRHLSHFTSHRPTSTSTSPPSPASLYFDIDIDDSCLVERQLKVSEMSLKELRRQVAQARAEGRAVWEIMRAIWERDVVPRGDRHLYGFKATLLPSSFDDGEAETPQRRKKQRWEGRMVSRTKAEGRMSTSVSGSEDEGYGSGLEGRLAWLLAKDEGRRSGSIASLSDSASSIAPPRPPSVRSRPSQDRYSYFRL